MGLGDSEPCGIGNPKRERGIGPSLTFRVTSVAGTKTTELDRAPIAITTRL
jgi:hypothetical protein